MNARVLGAIAVADFRERVRRPAFAATLIATVALAYAVAPPTSATYSVISAGGYRGVYDGAYLGTVLALMGGLWLSFAGFYVVKNAVSRDEATGVGQILAATPMRKAAYALGKFASNLLVLAALAAVLALMAPVMQLLRGESGELQPVAMFLPFLLFPLPMLAVTAAAAVAFETLGPLRGGFGNVVWFFGWMVVVGVAAAAGPALSPALDPLGFGAVSDAMRGDLSAQQPQVPDATLSAGLIVQEGPLKTFDFSGFDVTAPLLAWRLVLLLVALGLALSAARWFARFDPSRKGPATSEPAFGPAGSETSDTNGVANGVAAAPTMDDPPAVAGSALPRAPATRGNAFGGLVAGELRVLLRGVPRWWLFGALALTVASLVVPAGWVAFPMLPLAWIWPVLVWSRLGTQQREHDVHLLVDSGPDRRRRLATEWLAGLSVAALVGLGPLVRMGLSADWAGVAAWFGGLLFVPALALALGVLGRSSRLFQAVYLLLWYAVVNAMASVDFMGAVRDGGQLTGPGPLAVSAVAAVLLVVALATQEIRHARR